MATRRQRQRNLARAQFHQKQSRERNRAQAAVAARGRAIARHPHTRQSAVMVVDEPIQSTFLSRAELEGATVSWLRSHAQALGIKRTSIMRKATLVDAILAQR